MLYDVTANVRYILKIRFKNVHTYTHTHTFTHTYAPEVVYGICRPEFLHCNFQTVNPGK